MEGFILIIMPHLITSEGTQVEEQSVECISPVGAIERCLNGMSANLVTYQYVRSMVSLIVPIYHHVQCEFAN